MSSSPAVRDPSPAADPRDNEHRWLARLHRLAPLAAGAIFIAICWLLWQTLQSYSFVEIRRAIRSIPREQIAAAIVLTILNYSCLALVDRLAFKAAGASLSTPKIAAASLISYAASYNFGALLGGASMRFRLYSLWGMTAADILKVVTALTFAAWIGLLTVASTAFLIAAGDAERQTGLAAASLRLAGEIMACLVIAYLATTLVRRRPIRLGDVVLRLPPFPLALAQACASALELNLAALALWMLLPTDLHIPYPALLAGYMLAACATIASQSPGGLGVFELVVLSYVVREKSTAAIAAVVLYRVIYYLFPLSVAAVGYIIAEYETYQLHLRRVAAGATRWIAPLVPPLLAVLVFLCGIVLLVSGATPSKPNRLAHLAEWLPIHIIETGHLAGSIVGTVLLVLSRSIARRFDAAWLVAMLLVSAGIVASLVKGIDWEEAAILAIVLSLLAISRRQFYRRGAILHAQLSPQWWTAIGLTVAATIWLGFFAHKEVAYSNDLWWQFAVEGDAPRYLRASLVSVTTLLVLALMSLHGRPRIKVAPASSEEIEGAARIIDAQASTEAHLALMGDKTFLWNDDCTAFVVYAVRRTSWIALGDPVGPESQRLELLWRFHEMADSHGGRTVFHHVPAISLPNYLQLGLTPLKLGDCAHVDLASFSLEGPKHKPLRQVRNRHDREGYRFRVIPAADVPPLLPRLRQISDDWLAIKNTGEKRFSLGFFDEAYLSRLPIAVVEHEGQILAFANMFVTSIREELSVDLMRHVQHAPNGIMDYLFTQLLLWGKNEGYRTFNLGMAPLSGLDDHPLAPLWNKIGNALFEHGEHFYNYEGLRQYKQKFDPEWRPMYLCYPGGISLLRVMLDFAALNSGGVRGIVAKR